MVKKLLVGVTLVCVFVLILYKGISWYNLSRIRPTEHEVQVLKDNIGDIQIKDENDIVRIQNKLCDTLELIPYDENPYKEIIIDSVFNKRKGICFHRSIIMQKIFLYNKIKVTPVFLFHDHVDTLGTKISDILDKDLNSHNIFVIHFNDNEYVIETNARFSRLMSLDQYLNSNYMPKGTRYIRHLNNRNGTFIFPSWLPDIY